MSRVVWAMVLLVTAAACASTLNLEQAWERRVQDHLARVETLVKEARRLLEEPVPAQARWEKILIRARLLQTDQARLEEEGARLGRQLPVSDDPMAGALGLGLSSDVTIWDLIGGKGQ